MAKLIITSGDSAAGHLKQSRLADRVVGLVHQLTEWPTPYSSDPLGFIVQRQTLSFRHIKGSEGGFGDEAAASLIQLIQDAQHFDRVELWIDRDPNSQLILLFLVDLFRHDKVTVDKLWLVNAETPLGERRHEDYSGWTPLYQKLGEHEIGLASTAWRAYQQATPQSWFELLERNDLNLLPYLKDAIERLLLELPSTRCGLGQTQSLILSAVHGTAKTPLEVLRGLNKTPAEAVYGYWDHGRILDDLARCLIPAISGLVEGPFTMNLHDEKDRWQRYKRSRLTLTEFGNALLAGSEDFTTHNKIDRWFGGTKMTNHQIWKWDKGTRQLVAP